MTFKSKTEIRNEAADKYGTHIFDNSHSLGTYKRADFKAGWDERDKLSDEALKVALEALEKINKEELNSQRPGRSYSKSSTLSFEALAKIHELMGGA